MKTKTVLNEKRAGQVSDGISRVAAALREASMPFVAAQLLPGEQVVDTDGLRALESRLCLVERLVKLRPPEQNQQKTITFAVDVLRQRVIEARG